tara:strand:- start:1048 stop:1275 length:228 start_codon:yes stop_codon:yes gene_type:complete
MKKRTPTAALTLKLVYDAIREHNCSIGDQLDNNKISVDEWRRSTFPPLAISIIDKKIDDYRQEVIRSYKETADAS